MIASRLVGYILLAALAGSVILSLVILGVQWARSDQGKPAPPTKAPSQIYYGELPVSRVVYHSQPQIVLGD